MLTLFLSAWHLRGWAKSRAVEETKYCLQHNMGLGGATVVTIYKRHDGTVAPDIANTKPNEDGRNRLGYNPAEEARSISKEDWESVKSLTCTSSAWAASQLPWNVNSKEYSSRAKL